MDRNSFYVMVSCHDDNDGVQNVQIYRHLDNAIMKDVVWDYKTPNLDVNGSTVKKNEMTDSWSNTAISRNQPIYRNDDVWQGVKFNIIPTLEIDIALVPITAI